jgi:hypothetical protein
MQSTGCFFFLTFLMFDSVSGHLVGLFHAGYHPCVLGIDTGRILKLKLAAKENK